MYKGYEKGTRETIFINMEATVKTKSNLLYIAWVILATLINVWLVAAVMHKTTTSTSTTTTIQWSADTSWTKGWK